MCAGAKRERKRLLKWMIEISESGTGPDPLPASEEEVRARQQCVILLLGADGGTLVEHGYQDQYDNLVQAYATYSQMGRALRAPHVRHVMTSCIPEDCDACFDKTDAECREDFTCKLQHGQHIDEARACFEWAEGGCIGSAGAGPCNTIEVAIRAADGSCWTMGEHCRRLATGWGKDDSCWDVASPLSCMP